MPDDKKTLERMGIRYSHGNFMNYLLIQKEAFFGEWLKYWNLTMEDCLEYSSPPPFPFFVKKYLCADESEAFYILTHDDLKGMLSELEKVDNGNS